MSKIKEGNYIVIQSWMVTELGLKGNDLLVYAIIYGFSQGEQKFSGSLSYLSCWTNGSKQGVQNNLKNLCQRGLIVKEEKLENGIKYCSYYANELYTHENKLHGGYANKFDGVCNKFAQGMQNNCTDGMQQSCTNNTILDNLEEKKKDNGDAPPEQKFDEQGRPLNAAGFPIIDFGLNKNRVSL